MRSKALLSLGNNVICDKAGVCGKGVCQHSETHAHNKSCEGSCSIMGKLAACTEEFVEKAHPKSKISSVWED